MVEFELVVPDGGTMVLPVIWQWVFLTLALMTYAQSDLVSQRPVDSAALRPTDLRARLGMLKLSSRLRLRAYTDRLEGRLVLRTADSLGLRGTEGEVHLPLLAVDSLWVRRHHTGTGFLVGTVVGAGAYVLLTSFEDDPEVPELDNIFGGLLWAGSVALGTIVGRLIPHWKRVYP
jgi:hypothetical protein